MLFRSTFPGGAVIRYTLDFTTQSTQVDGTIYGERSGLAPVRGTFLTDRTPPDVTARCAGEGTKDVPLDISFTTQASLVNEPAQAERPKLRLAASPRTVAGGRLTSFSFRVTVPGGKPVPGAFVRFYGRRVMTGPDGRARIVATLRRRGAHPASAKLAGYRGARTAVRVRR